MTSEIKLDQKTMKQNLANLSTAMQDVETLSVEDIDSENMMDLNEVLEQINNSYKDVIDSYKNQLQVHILKMEKSVEFFAETDELLAHKLK